MYDGLIIGGGPAGYSCALYARRYGMKVIVFSPVDGGTVTKTHLIENYPGFESISGFELGMKITNHAKNLGAESVFAKVKTLEKISEKHFVITADDGKTYEGKSVLLASGTEHKKLGLESEKKLANRGVSYCATCDAAFFRGKTVAIIGGSDSAVKESLLLSQYAEKVYVICRGEKVKPEPINLKRMEAESKIEVIPNSNVIEVLGENVVEGVVLDTGKTLTLQGVFVAIGRIPQSQIAKKMGAKCNDQNEVCISRYSETNIPGFFAAGDVSDYFWKQAIVSSAQGAQAAERMYEYIS